MHGNEDSPIYDNGNLDVWQWKFTWMYGNSMYDNGELPGCMAIGVYMYVWQWGATYSYGNGI